MIRGLIAVGLSALVAGSVVASARLADPATRAAPAQAGAPKVGSASMAPVRSTGVARKIATVSGVRRVVLGDVVRVIIDLDAETPFHDERITGPPRIFVDLSQTRAAESLGERTLRFDKDGDVVRQVRIGLHPNAVTRVVLDAMGVSSYSVYPLYSPYRLVIDCVRATAAPTLAAELELEFAQPPIPARSFGRQPLRLPAGLPVSSGRIAEAYALRASSAGPAGSDARPGPLLARAAPFKWTRGLPSGTPSVKASVFDAASAAPLSAPSRLHARTTPLAAAAGPSSPALPPARSGFSIARQLGLGVSRVVIDPGHGGHDPGAQASGVSEAAVVLDVALRLEKLLQNSHHFEVILTRRTDEFVPLPERTAVANREAADLFLSIHVNASGNLLARGVETYYLNFASNLSAAAVAARENTASGQAMGALPDFVKAIALNNKLNESRDFATFVQHAMIQQLKGSNKTVRSLGVKQAPFVVLIGASMPSVLAEVSFVTNPREARFLKASSYRQQIAQALFDAIAEYQSSLGGTQSVASHQ